MLKLISGGELARSLSVSCQTVRNWREKKIISAIVLRGGAKRSTYRYDLETVLSELLGNESVLDSLGVQKHE